MGDKLSIRLLGAVKIEIAGKRVTSLGTRKAEALLAYLVMHKRPFSRERLADLLWDDRPQKQALANLRSLLSGMRRKIKPWLLVTRQTVAFNHDADYELDVTAFEEIGEQVTRKNSEQNPLVDPEFLITLYRGDFLEGFYLRDCVGFEEWSLLERERLQQIGIHALHQLAVDGLQNGRYTPALHYTDKLLRLDNLSEQTHRLKMELLVRNGRRNAALKQYAACRHILDEELGVEPAAATQALYERFRALTIPPPSHLPADSLTFRFFGREKVADEINGRLLAAHSQLLTIVGVGGMGKTRLAIHAARRIVQKHNRRFLDGVYFIPLSAIKTAVLLPFRIAEAIDFSFQGADPPAQQLSDHLQNKEMLLILDNMEQLLDEEESITLIADLLSNAPAITLLVTSRERLNLYEERVFQLSGLAVPPPDAPHPEQVDAIRLYIHRIRRRDHEYAPSLAQMKAVIRTCRLLDGMPLAIELATGWGHADEVIAEETEANLDFLQTTYRNIPSRQRSLRAMFNHSWELLSAELRTIFIALSIFRDTFAKEAGTAVAAAQPFQLNALTNKSLLEQDDDGRYHIHPLLKQFITEKERDRAAAIHRHTTFYLNFIEQQGRGESIAERHALRTDLSNIEALWQRAARAYDFATLDRAIPTLHHFFSAQSWFQEGINLFEYALSYLCHSGEEITAVHAQTLCELWGRKARMHTLIGQLPAAEEALAAMTPHLHHVTDLDSRSAFAIYAAYTQFYAGNYPQAVNLTKESLRLALQTDNLDSIASAYNFIGSCTKAVGEYEQARDHFKQAATFYRYLDDDIGTGIALHNMGNTAQAMGEYSIAKTHYEEAAALFKASDYTHGMATALTNAGRLALKQKEYAQAFALLNEGLALKRELGDKRGAAVALTGLGNVSLETGAYKDAHEQLTQAVALAEACGDVKSVLEARTGTAALALKEGRRDEAMEELTAVLNHPGLVQEVREQVEKLMDTNSA